MTCTHTYVFVYTLICTETNEVRNVLEEFFHEYSIIMIQKYILINQAFGTI